MTPTSRRVAIAVSTSFLLWCGWVVGRTEHHAFGDLSRGLFTDHFSHMNAARAFSRVGVDVWRQSFDQLFRPLTPDELNRLPDDVRSAAGSDMRFVPGWPDDKPLVASWSQNPRLYPPGDMLLVAPIALAYHFTPLTFAGASRLLILLFLLYAHVSLYFVLTAVAKDGPDRFAFLVAFLMYAELVHWALEGFYDVVVIAPLVLCALYLRERRALAAVVAFCAAAAMHFRALFFAPWVVWAVFLAISQRSWRTWRRRDWAAAGVGAALAIAALYPLSLLSPTLGSLPVNNKIAFAALPTSAGMMLALIAIAVVVAGGLAWARAWLDLALLGWFMLMLIQLHQAYPWHMVVLLPFLLTPGAEPRAAVARDARAVFFVAASVIVFNNTTVPFWLAKVFG
jgi:hypothetical protein